MERRRGFTMIEAVVVLIVLAVLTAFAVSRHSGDQAAWAEAEIIKSHVRYAQALATSYNTSQWSILFAGGSYSLLQNGNLSPVPLPGSASPTRNLTTGVSVTYGSGSLVFDDNGSPGDADRTIVLNGVCSILITGGTGLVP